eukprot:scaffold1051_cov119-Cylindrotheca_fusiformis.AAC.30
MLPLRGEEANDVGKTRRFIGINPRTHQKEMNQSHGENEGRWVGAAGLLRDMHPPIRERNGPLLTRMRILSTMSTPVRR